MLTDPELSSMRATVESSLPDRATISRPGAGRTFDAATGTYTVPTAEELWSGACRVRSQQTAERQVTIGSLPDILGRYIATLPHTAEGFAVDDYLTVTASTSAELVGRWFRIVEIRVGTWDLGRRLLLEAREP